MKINDMIFNADLRDILIELRKQLNANGIPLLSKMKETGNDIMVQCPYHSNGQERRPSAGIRKDDGTFHCFACGEIHSLQEVISFCFGKTDDVVGSFGWSWLLKNFLSVSITDRRDIDLDFSRSSKSSDVKFVSEEELDQYRYYHPYMWKRKLTPGIVEFFDVGYDKETDSITFPVKDIEGRTLFVARRSVRGKSFNYPENVEKPVYGLYELSQLSKMPSEIIICESMLDALVCWVWGKHAVALNGLGTELQFRQLNDLLCRKYILATDNDRAGMKARDRIRRKLKGKIITEYLLPEGKKDINDLTEEEFKNLQEIF